MRLPVGLPLQPHADLHHHHHHHQFIKTHVSFLKYNDLLVENLYLLPFSSTTVLFENLARGFPGSLGTGL